MHKLFLQSSLLILLSVSFSPIRAEEKYRIGYFEQNPHSYRQATTVAFEGPFQRAFQQALKDNHWDTLFEFPPEAYISIGTDVKEEGERQAQRLVTGDYGRLDAIFVRGPLATRAILKATQYNPSIPIFAVGINNPIKEGFVLNELDSGIDNFTVDIAHGRYSKMLDIFYHEVRFKKLGLLYFDEERKNQQAHVEFAENIAQDKGFVTLPQALVATETVSQNGQKSPPQNQCTQDTPACCLAALNILVRRGMDAFFIPSLNCFDWTQNDVKPLMDYLMAKRIPTFSTVGSKGVQGGAMMSFSSADLLEEGQHVAENLYQVLAEKKKPRELKMSRSLFPRMVVNTAVATKIGFKLSYEIQGASDEIYEEIWSRERILKENTGELGGRGDMVKK